MTKFFLSLCVAVMTATYSFAAMAADAAPVVPQPWQIMFQPAATPVAHRLDQFHDMLLYIIIAIAVFVLLLLVFVAFRFNARANPVPSKTTHNVPLEVLWTIVPVIILIVIAVPSFKLLYYMDRVEKPDMTLKVTGYQWYWGYEYPDQGGINFLSNMIPEKDIDKSKGQVRLLSTDNPVVVPVDTNIQVLVTAADVIHSFAMPAFGIKRDAVPGRTNETWFRVEKPGTYFGQCSEICGTGHAYMPIEIKAVTREEFDVWVADQKKAQGIVDAPAAEVAPAAAPVEAPAVPAEAAPAH